MSKTKELDLTVEQAQTRAAEARSRLEELESALRNGEQVDVQAWWEAARDAEHAEKVVEHARALEETRVTYPNKRSRKEIA